MAGSGRVLVVFQPHLVSRTKAFATAMGTALSAADVVVVTDIYLAREQAEEGVSGRLVADAITLPTADVMYEPDLGAVAGRLAAAAVPGDLVLTLGAGDVTEVGPQVLRLLENRTAGGRDG